MTRRRIGVVGAGIIGLTSAYALSREGHDVVVFDPAPARGATYAAAGMLAPSAEIAPGEERNYELQRDAVDRWRILAQQLVEDGAGHVALHDVGTLLTGWDASDRRLVQQSAEVLRQFGVATPLVTRDERPDAFTGLSDRITAGIWLAGDAWLDPDEAVATLTTALVNAGVSIVREAVEETVQNGPRRRVTTATGSDEFDAVIFATGAAPTVSGLKPQESVRPIRGVTVRLQGLDRLGQPMVRSFVRGRPFYLVGRHDGYCVVGASAEEKATASIETGEFYRLLRDALDVVPALETASWLETRLGHRPVAPSGEPFFESNIAERWAWSSGHYRHGVTLAPLAATWAVSFVQGLDHVG